MWSAMKSVSEMSNLQLWLLAISGTFALESTTDKQEQTSYLDLLYLDLLVFFVHNRILRKSNFKEFMCTDILSTIPLGVGL